ncbi:MAG: YciI family protein [Thermoleophilaceae bacterium]
MKYLLALITDQSAFAERTDEERREAMKGWDDYTNSAIEAGVYLGGEGLQPPQTATTVKLQESGEPLVSDGPFAETKEQLGGYYLLDLKDEEDALDWAKRIPMPGGTVEVRPVMDYEAAGSSSHGNQPEAEGARQ